MAGGYVDTQRNGSLMEKEAEGEVPRKGKERKKERKEERERERKRERANLHTLGAVEMSVEIE